MAESPVTVVAPDPSSDSATSDPRKSPIQVLHVEEPSPQYSLSKWRFPGVFALVILNIVGGMNWPWFGSISIQTAEEFNISVDKVNWLGNVVNLVFLPVSLVSPFLYKRYGIRACCFLGAVCLVLAAWVRYAGTAKSLHPRGAYALLLLAQIFVGIAQPLFQILGPKFSENWFDFNGRTTATMIISVANPIGSSLGELIPSFCGGARKSVLVIGIISTAVFPITFLIYSKPPSPPTFSGSLPSPPPLSTLRSLLNIPHHGDRKFPLRTRLDFFIIAFAFGVFVAVPNALSILTAQLFTPYGYSSTESGVLAAVVILAGLVSAIVTAPLFDRVFSRYITASIKLATPPLALCWLSLIWAVRPNNLGALFAVLAIAGILSFMLLPITLELVCELSRDAETSAAILWFTANLLGVVFVATEGALTAGADGSPPANMRRSSIFAGVVPCVAATFVVLGLQGLKESRKALDAKKRREEIADPVTAK